MPRVSPTMPFTDLRQNAAKALRRVEQSKRPMVVTHRGRTAAVLLSIETYERGEHERRLLRLLARGEREIARRAGHDLDRVLAEADDILAKR